MIINNPDPFIFRRNNLDGSSSPYLLQHASNPVWWQEWSREVLEYASNEAKPLFVSVGYSTCHWCHVMAAEAFSDENTADYLNEHFICIKVDREQRPDIDQYLMEFISRQNGNGGWPLNAFLTPDIRPIFALTYAPVNSTTAMRSLLSVAQMISEYFCENAEKVSPFHPGENHPPYAELSSLSETLSTYFDNENGGFGNRQKFPPHSTLLFLLYQLGINDTPEARFMCRKTLDAIQLRGLNDHLQGGVFRYCVDGAWTIPHFEKMLYDQAMVLWAFSLGYRVIGNNAYKTMAENILRCLQESFEVDGLYISAHDADTEHAEGGTYLWSHDELKEILSPSELESLANTYVIENGGNFEGKVHLIRMNDTPLDNIEEKLLSVRKARRQPAPDGKILCGINALTAIALIQAGRYLERPDLEEKASLMIRKLINIFWNGKVLRHSYFQGILQEQSFLFDAAATLTAITMLYENDLAWYNLMEKMTGYLKSFKNKEIWIESVSEDFHPVAASWFDHPVPSSISLAELGLTRAALLAGREPEVLQFRESFQSDFYNLTVLVNNGSFHLFTSPDLIPWKNIPVNSLQRRGTPSTDCYNGTCMSIEPDDYKYGQ